MEFSNIVLLYSKYSPNSKKMLDLLQHSDIDLRLLSIQKVCIDNENIRKSIISSSSIEIKSVPAILVLYPDGGVEKFDGAHSFQFIQNVIQNYIQMNTPQQPVQPPPQQAPQPPPQQAPQQAPQQPSKQHNQDHINQSKQIKKPKQAKNKSSNKTSINDLFSESENETQEEEEEEEETQDGLEIIENTKREPSSSSKKSNSNTSSILAKAQELAKVREKEESSKPKRPLVM